MDIKPRLSILDRVQLIAKPILDVVDTLIKDNSDVTLIHAEADIVCVVFRDELDFASKAGVLIDNE